MRKVTARELQQLGVGHGEPLPLSDKDKVELSKAKILKELEATYGNDFDLWIRILRRAKLRIKKEPHHTAIIQLLEQLEARHKRKRDTKMAKPGTLKLDGWQPQAKPDEEMCKRLRQYCVEAIFARWHEKGKPSELISIYFRINDRINKDRQLGLWPREWKHPGKRTIDRRVNEAADPRFSDDGVPKIVAVTAGVYQPNPALFEQGQ